MGLEACCKDLLAFYKASVRPRMEQVPTLQVLDDTARVLDAALSQETILNIGFLGESQVGKSTLINALLDARVLPAGGVGPLTAQEIQVSYGKPGRLDVTYQDKGKLHQFSFALERILERSGDLRPMSRPAEPPPEAEGEASELVNVIQELDRPVGDGAQATPRHQHIVNQARCLLQAPEGASPELLVDGVRAVLGQKPRCGVSLDPVRATIDRVRGMLGAQEAITATEEPTFRKAIDERAAGPLAPLVKRLHLAYPAELLRYLHVVDLPGVGVTGDPGAHVAERFVRERAHALVYVMRNNGMTDEVARLLESTGVVSKLLFHGGNGAPAMEVVLAVTCLDNVARERIERAEDLGEPVDSAAVFQELARDMQTKVRAQLKDALRQSQAFEDLPEAASRRRGQVVDDLASSVDVVSVVAPDYLLHASKRGHKALLPDEEATGIPALRRRLEKLAASAMQRRHDAIAAACHRLCDLLRTQLDQLVQAWQEGDPRAQAAWDRFRARVRDEARALREEMTASRGEVLAALRKGLPAEIRGLCKDAEMQAHKKLTRLGRRGSELHYQSLGAALRRGGVWDRKEIHYPDALTLSFVDAIATDWGPKIVEGVRCEMKDLARRDSRLLERLCSSLESDPFIEQVRAHVSATTKLLKQGAQTCIAWTDAQVEALKEKVRQELVVEVRKPIEAACKRAIDAGRDKGAGAKTRILEAFHEGGEKAIEKAAAKALALLQGHYEQLAHELQRGYLSANRDPLATVVRALTEQADGHEPEADKGGQARRRKERAQLQELRARMDTFEACSGSPAPGAS